jgi:REP element-mobilizing transposase RayT
LRWRETGRQGKFVLWKGSFVPEYVHLPIRVQPAVSSAEVAWFLMNSAQELMFESFPDLLIQAKAE